MYYLPTEFTEVLAVLTDLHLLNLLTQTGTITGTWKRIITYNFKIPKPHMQKQTKTSKLG